MRFYAYWLFILLSSIYILANPYYGILLYSCMNIIRPELLFWGGSGYSANSMSFIALATILGVLFNAGKLQFRNLKNVELILIFIMYIGIIISIKLSDYTIERQYYYANEILKIGITCSLILVLLENQRKIIIFEQLTLACIVFLAIWGIEQNYRGNYRLEKLGGYDSNGIAAYFALFFPVALSYLIESKIKMQQMIGCIASFIILLAIIFTQSRGGLLGTFAGSFYFILKTNKKKKILTGLLIIALLAVPFLPKTYTERMSTMTSEEKIEGEGSALSRIYLWQAGVMIFLDNPLFGTGLLSYPEEKFNYEHRFMHLDPDFREWLFRKKDPKVTHNTYIKYMADCGLFVTLPFLLIYFNVFRKNRIIRNKCKKNPHNQELLYLLNGIESGIVGNAVSNFFIDANFMIFIYIQLIICISIQSTVLKSNYDK